MESSSSSGSLKRVRTPTSGSLVPSCLVDGCASDLSKCRDYHRRHKVCELHSKTSVVHIRGQEQRFCQQCSRFHSLVEFDEGKRSCRKRLDGHNRRRRKPQPDSLSVNSARLFSNHQGTRYLQFGGSQLFPSHDSSPSWMGPVKTETDPMLYGADQSSLNMGIGHRGGKHFPFLQSSSSSSSSSSHSKMLSHGANRAAGSSHALSLLSSEAREIGLSHVAQCDSSSVVPSLGFGSLGLDCGPVGSVSGGSSNANGYSQEFFQMGVEGSSTSGSHQTLSFSWE